MYLVCEVDEDVGAISGPLLPGVPLPDQTVLAATPDDAGDVPSHGEPLDPALVPRHSSGHGPGLHIGQTHATIPGPGGQLTILGAWEPDHAEDVALVRSLEPRHLLTPDSIPHDDGPVITPARQ